MIFNKRLQYELLNNDFETMSTTLLRQFAIVEILLNKGWKDDLYEQLVENEKSIDQLEVMSIKRLQEMFLLFSPKAKELRKSISCHESLLALEQIGDLLMNFVDYLQKTDLQSPDYRELHFLLKQMFDCLKQLVNATTFSFFAEDKMQAYQVIEKENCTKNFSRELSNGIIAGFQEIPLSGQELQNLIHLHTMAYILEKIRTSAIYIAKSTIFAIEGTDIRH